MRVCLVVPAWWMLSNVEIPGRPCPIRRRGRPSLCTLALVRASAVRHGTPAAAVRPAAAHYPRLRLLCQRPHARQCPRRCQETTSLAMRGAMPERRGPRRVHHLPRAARRLPPRGSQLCPQPCCFRRCRLQRVSCPQTICGPGYGAARPGLPSGAGGKSGAGAAGDCAAGAQRAALAFCRCAMRRSGPASSGP